MDSNMNPNLIKKITDEKSINVFVNAVKTSKKNEGIVKMPEPVYKFKMGKESYYLWIRKDEGTIINTNDSHYSYRITKTSATKIYEIIQGK
jgi:hypothetical protein